VTIKKLIAELCKREGLKKQVDVAQVTEIVGHLADILKEEWDAIDDDDIAELATFNKLIALAEKRAKKKK
jgi:predicted house-cleaning noncanonical NTP pyrophosphatase (MazG superfamily)